ncbi:uncharacterized protein BJ212DRAFT_1589354 [Suillus subaureus]|uniref:Uncharacterized protein n=1 Tax=Suillus subaureus TaxID=48587 RepID=A0A9P7JAS3_9AGAM|nr:uncharacterized protein BJ212DRAFT_1589354 [Suillus subaureus]KAG1811431.1 hypothetical protein BJ212DRAFT_1589354 [Suillus subaureus]
MHGHPQIFRPRSQQRPGRFKNFRLTVTRSPRSGPPPASTPALPTALPPAAEPTAFKAQLRHLFTWRSDHAAPAIVTVDVPFAQAKERNAAAGAPKPDEDVVPDEYLDDHPPNPDTQQQSTVAQVDTGEHGDHCKPRRAGDAAESLADTVLLREAKVSSSRTTCLGSVNHSEESE